MECKPPDVAAHGLIPPSDWVLRFAGRVPHDSRVLDLACGTLRHAEWFARHGYRVLAVDRLSRPAILDGAGWPAAVDYRELDLEAGSWPLGEERFSAVVVTNYLHRPLRKHVVDAVAPGGWLLYETFAEGNEQFGHPSRPDFLLAPGELLSWVDGCLVVAAYEHGEVDRPRPAVVQRIAAYRLP